MSDSLRSALRLGAHTSASGGVHHALYEAESIGADVTQLFTANQRRWEGKALSSDQLNLWKKAQEETGIRDVMSHASYLINLAAPDPEVHAKSLEAMRQELGRCRALGIRWLNFHPGSSVTGNEAEGLERIVQSLLQFKHECPDEKLMLLLEATAGQGTQLGWRLEHLGYIIERVKNVLPIGVCVDTCHVFAAGYDLRGNGWNQFMEDFDTSVGLPFLEALHLNDSLKDLGLRVDRHAALGMGKIGWECFQSIVRHPFSRQLPLFLETPGGTQLWKEEICKLRQLANQEI